MQPYQFIFEDSEILVVNKSSGIPSQSDNNNTPSLLEILSQERPNIYLIHRLDQRVSGLIIFAKTEHSATQLNKDFQTRNITKKYRAIVANKPVETEAKLTHWLLKDAKNMKEILGVQQEINGVQESIESASGRVKYLTHQSAYSTVHLQYFQNMQTGVPAESQSGYLVRLGNSFYASISVIGDLFVLIVILWPVILGVLIALIIWKKRKINLAKSQ